MTPEQLSKGPVFAAARRAFTHFVLDEARNSTASRLDYSGTTRESMLKVEVLERISALTRAEADLSALLRPDLTEADFAETLARWMLYLAGGDVNVDRAITKVLEAVAPLIEQDMALKIAAVLEREAAPDRLPQSLAPTFAGFDPDRAAQAGEMIRNATRDTYFDAAAVACEVAFNARRDGADVADTQTLHAEASRQAMRLDMVTQAVSEQLARTMQAALPDLDPRHAGEVLLTVAPMLLGLSHRAAQHPDGMTAEKMADVIYEVVTHGGRILYGRAPAFNPEG